MPEFLGSPPQHAAPYSTPSPILSPAAPLTPQGAASPCLSTLHPLRTPKAGASPQGAPPTYPPPRPAVPRLFSACSGTRSRLPRFLSWLPHVTRQEFQSHPHLRLCPDDVIYPPSSARLTLGHGLGHTEKGEPRRATLRWGLGTLVACCVHPAEMPSLGFRVNGCWRWQLLATTVWGVTWAPLKAGCPPGGWVLLSGVVDMEVGVSLGVMWGLQGGLRGDSAARTCVCTHTHACATAPSPAADPGHLGPSLNSSPMTPWLPPPRASVSLSLSKADVLALTLLRGDF